MIIPATYSRIFQDDGKPDLIFYEKDKYSYQAYIVFGDQAILECFISPLCTLLRERNTQHSTCCIIQSVNKPAGRIDNHSFPPT